MYCYINDPYQVIFGNNVFLSFSDAYYPRLYVPFGTLEAYASRESSWRGYFNEIVEMPHDGDVDCDGIVTVSDVVAMIDILMGSQSNYIQDYHADIDCNGEFSILDVTTLIDILLSSSN